MAGGAVFSVLAVPGCEFVAALDLPRPLSCLNSLRAGPRFFALPLVLVAWSWRPLVCARGSWLRPVGSGASMSPHPSLYRSGRLVGAMFASCVRPTAPPVPTCVSTHACAGPFVVWNAEWIFNTFQARTLRFEPCPQIRAYPLDCLLSSRIMDRSIYSGSARELSLF